MTTKSIKNGGFEVWTRIAGASAATVLLLAGQVAAQQGVVAKNFRISPGGWHAPPNDRQMKSLLEGASARPEQPGRYLVQGARFRTFSPQGATLMEVMTPEAHYDDTRKEIYSAQTLQMRTAEGKFAIEGQGFLWRQTNSSLIISNRVRTTVSPELLQARRGESPSETQGPIQIEANSFEYHGATGLGTYLGKVQVTGTNLSLAGDRLVIQVPLTTDLDTATNVVVQSIALERQVVIDYEGVHATGERVLYTTGSGLVELDGNPAWRTEHREGAADRILIDPSNRVFRALGNASLKLSGPEVERAALLGGWFESGGDSAPRTATGRELEFKARNYEIRTNLAVFDGGVQVQEREAGRDPGTLVCEQLQLEFSGTNELKSMVAEGGVAASQGDRKLNGKQLTYSGAEKRLKVTGAPEWQAGGRSGRGDFLEANTQSEELLVRGNAVMRLPAREFAAPTTAPPQPGAAVSPRVLRRGATASPPAVTQGGTNAIAEIRCSEYRVSRSAGQFMGGVEIDHPQMRWWTEELTIRFPPEGGTAEEIVAAPARFELFNPRGQINGKGDRAVYRHSVLAGKTNSLLTLTGVPATLTQTNGPSIASSSLLLDLANSTFLVPPGKYRVLGPTNAVVDTNVFQFPRGLGTR